VGQFHVVSPVSFCFEIEQKTNKNKPNYNKNIQGNLDHIFSTNYHNEMKQSS
jgi:hypothetical protein